MLKKAEVLRFGSYESGLCCHNSDVDITIILPGYIEPDYFITHLASELKRIDNNSKVEQILTARVPLLKF
jgi:DNA polymerase sigma